MITANTRFWPSYTPGLYNPIVLPFQGLKVFIQQQVMIIFSDLQTAR